MGFLIIMDKVLTQQHITDIGLSGWIVALVVLIIPPLVINISNRISNRTTVRRKKLYKQIKPLWERNHEIFLEYGPHENNDSFYDLEGDATEEWRKKVKEIMLPNHQKIRDICSKNLDLMTENEMKLFYQYEDHVADFKSCHESGYLPNRRFPQDIVKIFKD